MSFTSDELADLLDVEQAGSPATYTDAAGVTHEICGIFKRPYAEINVGEIAVQDAAPTFLCASDDVPGVDETCLLDVHAIAVDESGGQVYDEQGNGILVEEIYHYHIVAAHASEDGLTDLILSADPT